MSHPLRENLEVFSDTSGDWVRCTRCAHVYCREGEDWRAACQSRLLPPTDAGPLMNVLVGQYLLRQLSCPACGALVDSEIVEDTNHDHR